MDIRLVFTAYNRPVYWDAALATWHRARGFADLTPVVHLEPGDAEYVMSAIAAGYGVAVHRNLFRRGVLTNPWYAIDTAFAAGADFVILGEDDIEVSDDIVEYFTWAATELRDEHILAVCACSMDTDADPAGTHTVRTHQVFNPLVWGTWRDRCADVLRDTWDHDYSSGTPAAPQSGWDWNINLRVMRDWRIAAPLHSRSTHIGQYGGTHMHPAAFPASQAPTFARHRPAAPYRYDCDR